MVAHLPYNLWKFLDPCAGDGRWLPHLGRAFPHSNLQAFDIAPDHPRVAQMDFLTQTDPLCTIVDVIVSNPPFGKSLSLAHKVFNRAAEYEPQFICVLVPRSFGTRLTSLRQLSTEYTRVASVDMPSMHFERKDGHRYGEEFCPLQCTFQIWRRQPRKPLPDFEMDECTDADGKPVKVRYRASRHGYILMRPSNNKDYPDARFEDGEFIAGSSDELPVRERFQDIPGFFASMAENVRSIVTHGPNAGRVVDFDPDNDRASMRQFIWAPGYMHDRIALIEQSAFAKYLEASGNPRTPSLSSEEIIECIDSALDGMKAGHQQFARQVFKAYSLL